MLTTIDKLFLLIISLRSLQTSRRYSILGARLFRRSYTTGGLCMAVTQRQPYLNRDAMDPFSRHWRTRVMRGAPVKNN